VPMSGSHILAKFNDRVATVKTVEELLQAVADQRFTAIMVDGFLSDVPAIRLSPHQAIVGTSPDSSGLKFLDGADGIELSSDNAVSSLTVVTSPDRLAIWNDESVSGFGTLEIDQVRTVGRVRLFARDRIKSGRVEVRGLDIIEADARGATERPHGYGVFVLQGAFTLWNLQPDPEVKITANISRLSVGRQSAPVLGSGVFVAGQASNGGSLHVERLETGAVYCDGRIKAGTPNQITGGVFVLDGAVADLVENRGPVTTFGANDMALDNWGFVDRWLALDKITTLGPSGIGFVNFGVTRTLELEAPIETFGQGARGFNIYAGTVQTATFDRIITHADGAVGVQISQPAGKIAVRRGIETYGGTGPSLVKGVIQQLSAIALSVKPGGQVDSIEIRGGLKTHGREIPPLEQLGSIRSLSIEGGCAQDCGAVEPVSPN
jgi:hypothetical protein